MIKKYIQFFSLALSLVLLTGFFCCCSKKDEKGCVDGVCPIEEKSKSGIVVEPESEIPSEDNDGLEEVSVDEEK